MSDPGYSLANARAFRWPSITGKLSRERLSHLAHYLCGRKILDAGCGGGGYSESLAAQGMTVIGVDKIGDFLRIAQVRSSRAKYVQADLVHLPFESKSFDCTFCFDVLEHVDDEAAISELARVTKNRLLVAVPRQDETDLITYGLTFFHYRDPTHRRYYSEDTLKHLVCTIRPQRAVVFPELFVPTRRMVQELIDYRGGAYSQISPAGVDASVRRHLPKTKAAALVKTTVRRTMAPVFAHLIRLVAFKQIPTGLVAVVDLR